MSVSDSPTPTPLVMCDHCKHAQHEKCQQPCFCVCRGGTKRVSPTPTPITAEGIRDFVERAGPTGALDGGRDMLLRAADALAAMTAARDAAEPERAE